MSPSTLVLLFVVIVMAVVICDLLLNMRKLKSHVHGYLRSSQIYRDAYDQLWKDHFNFITNISKTVSSQVMTISSQKSKIAELEEQIESLKEQMRRD